MIQIVLCGKILCPNNSCGFFNFFSHKDHSDHDLSPYSILYIHPCMGYIYIWSDPNCLVWKKIIIDFNPHIILHLLRLWSCLQSPFLQTLIHSSHNSTSPQTLLLQEPPLRLICCCICFSLQIKSTSFVSSFPASVSSGECPFLDISIDISLSL